MADGATQLALFEPETDDRTARYRDVLDRLSGALTKATIESNRLGSHAFLDAIAEFRQRLTRHESGAAVAGFPDTCSDYFTRVRAHLLEREHEYLELIGVLRSTVGRLAGESDAFQASLLETSTRLNRFADLDDLRQIKQRLSQESLRLKEETEAQKRREAKTVSRLTRRIETLEACLDEAQEQAVTDALTGVANRGRFDQMLQRWLDHHAQSGEPFALGLADIDDFKSINDTHGHPVGDRVILCTAQWLQASVRGTDFVARYGGEEFAVLFSHTTAAEAAERLTGVLRTLGERRFDYDSDEGPQSVGFTVSAGVAETVPGDTAASLIRRADDGLYRAKRKGKKRVVVQTRTSLRALFG